jgi:HlyD family secretion protein
MTRLTDAVRRATGRTLLGTLDPAELRSPWELDESAEPVRPGRRLERVVTETRPEPLVAAAPAIIPAPAVAPSPAAARSSAAISAPTFEVVAAPRRRRAPLFAAALIAAGVLAWWMWPAGATTVRVAGVIEANEAVVSATLTARMLELRVQEGDRVEAGAVMAVLDRAELEAERARQLAAIRQLTAKLAQMRQLVTLESDRSGGRRAVAQAALDTAQQQREQAAAELAQRRADADRVRNLFAQGYVSRQDSERAATEVRVAEAQLQSRISAVASAQADVVLARAGERQVTVASADVDRTQAELRQAEAQLAAVDARLAQTIVRAPLSGVVSTRIARQGEVVEAGRPIVTIVDDRNQWVLAAADERDAARVRLGAPVEIELASGARLSGTVTHVAAESEFATRRDVSRARRDIRSVAFRVALPRGTTGAHKGLTAYVHLQPGGMP